MSTTAYQAPCDSCGRTNTVKGVVYRNGQKRLLCHANFDGTKTNPDCYSQEV